MNLELIPQGTRKVQQFLKLKYPHIFNYTPFSMNCFKGLIDIHKENSLCYSVKILYNI